MTKNHTRSARIGIAFGVALLALTGCTAESGSAPGAGSLAGSAVSTSSDAKTADSITIEDAWVKSAAAGDMTAGFGTLENAGSDAANIVSVQSTASPMMELHETVANESGQMVMREVEGGFVIPAKDHLHLEPGGNHIMMMDLPSAVRAGDDVTFTLTFADDSTYEFTAIVKDYSGGNENYEGDGDSDAADAPHVGH